MFAVTIYINDSKKLSPIQKIKAEKYIKKNALAFSIGASSVSEINKLGIVKATNRAHRRAIANCQIKINHLLADAFLVPRVASIPKKNQTAITKGDTISISIAAASIIAKQARDRIMQNLHNNYKLYSWDKNKGYGTSKHRQSILTHGVCKHHRKLFTSNLSSFPPQFGA